MATAHPLHSVALFSDMSEVDIDRICADVTDVALPAGATLFEEGDEGDSAYLVVSGEVEVVKTTEDQQVVLAVHGPGAVIGEMALLREAPRSATVRARQDAALIAIPKDTLDELLETSPGAARAVFRALVARMQDTAEQLRHAERMAQLGTLTAGVAHELNNPAAAVQRGASRLVGSLHEYTQLLLDGQPDGGAARKAAWQLLQLSSGEPRPTGLARSDLEDRMESLLESHDITDAWQLAAGLVDAGIVPDAVAEFLHSADPPQQQDALQFMVAAAQVVGIAGAIEDAAIRLSTIIKALKGYSYLDRAPVQNVNVIDGLEDTIVLLSHKLGDITVLRNYADDMPTITALGGDLNQVWTNLIDNAADAIAGTAEPTITIRVSFDDEDVWVEIEDNGPGIPEDSQTKVFDAFFTTKPPGHGTGLGLQTCYRIVVHEHHGTLTFTSEPGRTVFSVRLPRSGPFPGRMADDQPLRRD